ncbi:hypothetical protein PG985_003613 [Apiospora marii]|uniref:uncharacterized protein n=1 Tax=Apiospora marii TaxID=335849 RepID=UPI003130EC1C
MVGIPKSNRCSFCKARKTKCDEAWPTCGTCQRAKRQCSGPPRMKFVINGCHSASGGYDSASSTSSAGSDTSTPRDDATHHPSTPSPPRTMRRRQPRSSWERNTPKEGGSFPRMQLSEPPKPRDMAPAPAERLAAELVFCLDAAPGTGYDLRMWGSSLELIPPLIDQSAVLQHATKLLTTCWTNMRRGWPRRAWLDAQVYDAALIGLQQALEQACQDPASNLATSTLAAQTILQKVEIACNDRSVNYQSNHGAGLSAVISAGVCDQGFSELRLHLIFESSFAMLMGDIRCGKDSVFAEPTWSRALHKALDETPLKPKLLTRFYRFKIEMAIWPTLVRQLRHLHENPADSMLAADVALRVSALLEYLDEMDKSVFAKAMELGSILEVENSSNDAQLFTPTSYDFANYILANFFRAHAFFTIVMLRILQCANSFLYVAGPYGYTECGGDKDPSCHHSLVQQQQQQQQQPQSQLLLDFSRRLWQVYPYMQRRQPLELGGAHYFVAAYEAGDARQKALTCALLRDGSLSPPLPCVPFDEEDATIVAGAMALTGRSLGAQSVDESIDWDAELQGMDLTKLDSELLSWDLQGPPVLS